MRWAGPSTQKGHSIAHRLHFSIFFSQQPPISSLPHLQNSVSLNCHHLILDFVTYNAIIFLLSMFVQVKMVLISIFLRTFTQTLPLVFQKTLSKINSIVSVKNNCGIHIANYSWIMMLLLAYMDYYLVRLQFLFCTEIQVEGISHRTLNINGLENMIMNVSCSDLFSDLSLD